MMTDNGSGGANNNGGDKEEEEEEELSVPRGGPIYVPNVVGPLTSVPLFLSSILQELQDLEVEVSSNSSQVCDEDISVDELKILTEEELVDMAITEAFKDDEGAPILSPISEEPSNERSANDSETSNDKDCKTKRSRRKRTNEYNHALEDDEGTSNLSPIPEELSRRVSDSETSNDKACTKTLSKRKRTKANAHALNENYIARVERVKRIKEKQEEDKAAVTLHSFNRSSKMTEPSIASSRTIDRMKPLRSASSSVKVKSSSLQEYVPVQYPDVALSIEVYQSVQKRLKNQELLVLGQQTLTELRDKIDCLTDHVMQKAGQHDPSGYFLVEDTFCNDLRDPSAVDYSKPIFDWLKDSKGDAVKKWESVVAGELKKKQKAVVGDVTGSQLPSFRAVDMDKTKFSDLKFRLGAGYLYCHQGDCRHTFVIRDMRLIHPQDIQNRAAYPILLFQVKPVIQKCYACKIFRATKVTVDDKWAQENPCYFCDDCYYLLHYKDGHLLYDDFSVYDYHHD
ncbi:snRNA-activating protein complex subunit [Pyrus x bretschneideri]|uniref:snRNA-activating protein complex subunit n=1 Tax=Pyrus x bretschneideri TaxID=225117 RepID=UPI0005115BBF|nr:snRNA-activating protein complex subunit [Pyrus x bretschneideri]